MRSSTYEGTNEISYGNCVYHKVRMERILETNKLDCNL
jgi:hypothetical protein